MEIQELKNVWQESNKTNPNQWKVNTLLLKEVSLKKTHSLLGEYKFTAIFETISYGIFWICIVGFMVDHWQEAPFAISAALLGLYAILGLIWGIYKWRQIQTINYRLPLAEAQKRVARFQLFERREIRSLLVLIPVFFVLFAIVASKSFLGLDLFELFPMWKYLILGSILIALLMVWILLKFPDKQLQKAQEFLKEIKEYEKEA